MNVNSLIITTLEPLGLPVKQDIYTGSADKYITFNYADERGELFADDIPQQDVASMQIHLITPKDFNYFQLKKDMRSRLFEVGFSYAQISSFYENETDQRHTIFECEFVKESED